MSHSIRLVLTLHNHQPVGNFDGVFEQAYQDSYKPFLDVLDRFPHLPIALHTSGSLMEWLSKHHPEYVDRLAAMVDAGRLEVIGGAYYEAILPMLPTADRLGQIQTYTEWLESRLGARVRGMWIPERVWEPNLVSNLAEAGIEYTILDDFHFKNAGVDESQLFGYYLSEDEGRLLKIFAGSERLRYLIPFADPPHTIEYLRGVAEKHPGSVLVFGDDGEKFGTWPETKKHVYEHGWLERFLSAISANQSWIKMTTLSEAVDNVAPSGKIYLPEASYREMTEWALPVDRQLEYDRVTHDMEHDHRWGSLRKFIRGGFWRNFKIKYPETDEMYTRMMQVSRRLAAAQTEHACGTNGHTNGRAAGTTELLERARTELYRGQCNCPYWHGAFGGLYLPHLRQAIYNHLIAADNLIDQATRPAGSWVEASADDYNLDARQEIQLANDKLVALLAPARGGMLYELDIRSICLNLLATLARRPESYHRKVLAGTHQGHDQTASIHDRVVFKQSGLDQKLIYDNGPRKSLIDHFYDNEVAHGAIVRNQALERGDFAAGIYEARLRRSPGRVQAVLSRTGNAWGHPLSITKSITLEAGSNTLQIDYQLEGLPKDRPFHFAVELNLAGLPSGADDRYFYDRQNNRLGHLGSLLDLDDVEYLGLKDEWLGIGVELGMSRPSGIWTFPIETVSNSEAGFESVHQSVVVLPHWLVQGDAQGKWQVSLTMALDTSLAESRAEPSAAVAQV